MVEIYNDFLTDDESEELIQYYKQHLDSEFHNEDSVYNFKGVRISEWNSLMASKKLTLIQPSVIRVQLINPTLQVTENFHTHRDPYSYVLFLSDAIIGGNLELDNILIKPKKNQLIVFDGNLKHRVTPVTKGDRYTLVSFTLGKSKIRINKTKLI